MLMSSYPAAHLRMVRCISTIYIPGNKDIGLHLIAGYLHCHMILIAIDGTIPSYSIINFDFQHASLFSALELMKR